MDLEDTYEFTELLESFKTGFEKLQKLDEGYEFDDLESDLKVMQNKINDYIFNAYEKEKPYTYEY